MFQHLWFAYRCLNRLGTFIWLRNLRKLKKLLSMFQPIMGSSSSPMRSRSNLRAKTPSHSTNICLKTKVYCCSLNNLLRLNSLDLILVYQKWLLCGWYAAFHNKLWSKVMISIQLLLRYLRFWPDITHIKSLRLQRLIN